MNIGNTRWLRSPLLHFCVLGSLIFAVAPRRAGTAREIRIAAPTLSALRAAEAERLGVHELAADRASEVERRAIEDEVLYREALRLSLDRDDPLVRQRLIQKLLLLVEDMGGASRAPTDAELRAYFDETRDRWRRPPRYHVVHVFASRPERLPEPPASVEAAASAGEAFPYPRDLRESKDTIERVYGAPFAAAVAALPAGTWSEPVASTFGWHRVRVVERIPGAPASYEESRADMELDFMMARRARVVGAFMKKTASEYAIVVDGAPLRDFTPTVRVAMRADPSAED